MINDRVDHRGYGREEGDLFEVGQKVHEFIDLEPGDDNLSSTTEKRPVNHHNVSVDTGAVGGLHAVDEGREMMPSLFQIEAGCRAHAHPFNIIRTLGYDHPRDR